ncbi:DUF1775 domain-containing protein [Streptomyces sp. AC558_RSS880]|uniref:DUF1775 domain-containing protein n=1 Tax=Streptomyces sp. AC558_RSS880 TaxID=2823687 RepID=UPI0035B42615
MDRPGHHHQAQDGRQDRRRLRDHLSGGKIAPGQYEDFNVAFGQLPDDTGQLTFKTLQTYSDGKIVRWIEAQGGQELENPAPVLKLTAKGARRAGALRLPRRRVRRASTAPGRPPRPANRPTVAPTSPGWSRRWAWQPPALPLCAAVPPDPGRSSAPALPPVAAGRAPFHFSFPRIKATEPWRKGSVALHITMNLSAAVGEHAVRYGWSSHDLRHWYATTSPAMACRWRSRRWIWRSPAPC